MNSPTVERSPAIPPIFLFKGLEQLVQLEEDDYEVATATSVEEAKELSAAGFEYFTTINRV